jgi:methionyl aminopeptidase
MSIRNQRDFEKLRAIGLIVRLALDQTAAAVRPGITTRELDRIGARVLAEQGAESAPPKVYGFPGALCISVNDEAIHGIPGDRVICAGDLVKLDLVAEKDGYYADAAVTVAVGEVSASATALARCAESAFRLAAKAARVGNRVYEIGRAVEHETRRCGFQVMRELCGHGVGRTIHEAPSVPNYHDPRFRARLTEGLVITIEPIIAAGGPSRRPTGAGPRTTSTRWRLRKASQCC